MKQINLGKDYWKCIAERKNNEQEFRNKIISWQIHFISNKNSSLCNALVLLKIYNTSIKENAYNPH